MIDLRPDGKTIPSEDEGWFGWERREILWLTSFIFWMEKYL
jgi:hypothetical protein